MLNDDTQRYGLLNDAALIILCTDFKIGVYIYKSFLHIPDIWVRRLAAAKRQCGEAKRSLGTLPPSLNKENKYRFEGRKKGLL